VIAHFSKNIPPNKKRPTDDNKLNPLAAFNPWVNIYSCFIFIKTHFTRPKIICPTISPFFIGCCFWPVALGTVLET